jgi:SAM-dependent methyltransferase
MDYFSIRLNKYPRQRNITWRAITKYLQQFIPVDASVLDIAAGKCLFINNVIAAEKFAIDIDKNFVQYANSNVKTKICNALDLHEVIHLDNKKIDIIFSSNFLEHLTLPDSQKLLRKIRQILNLGGLIILMQPNYRYCYKNYWDDFTHKTAFSHTSLMELLQSEGFEIKKCYKKFMPLTLNSTFAIFSFLVPIYLLLPIKPMAKQMLIIAKKNSVL